MAGTLTISSLSDGTNTGSVTDAIKGSAKAWVNFNGTTGSIRASYNVSSITVNAGADYTVNFTNALTDANYCAVVASNSMVSSNGNYVTSLALHPHGTTTLSANRTTSTVRVQLGLTTAAVVDANVAIFR